MDIKERIKKIEEEIEEYESERRDKILELESIEDAIDELQNELDLLED